MSAPLWASLQTETNPVQAVTSPTLSLSFFRETPADVLLPHVLSDRGYHFGREGDTRYYSRFRHLLLPGKWHRQRVFELKQVCQSVDSIHTVGSIRVDILRELRRSHVRDRRDGHTLTVLIAPSSGRWKNAAGQALGLGEAELQELKALLAPHCDLRISLHPSNRHNKAPVTNDLLDADLVISDYSSVLYEAWAIGKPVAFPRWLFGDRIIAHAPYSAEGHILQNRIGLHPETPEELRSLLQAVPPAPGDDVDRFMDDYLDNYRGGSATQRVMSLLGIFGDPAVTAYVEAQKAQLDTLISRREWLRVEDCAHQLIEMLGDIPEAYDALATSLHGRGKWWQEVVALETLIALTPQPKADYWMRLGKAQEIMRRPAEAAKAYRKAIARRGKGIPADWHFRLGCALEAAASATNADEPTKAARHAYAQAIATDTRLSASRFGIGVFHAAKGDWPAAAKAYIKMLSTKPGDAELCYRTGMAHDRCYDWAAAERFYCMAIATDPTVANWHFRLGFVRERQQKFQAAADAYEAALSRAAKHTPYWAYRRGYVLEKTGDLKAACQAFLGLVTSPVAKQQPLETQDDTYTHAILQSAEADCRAILERDVSQPGPWQTLAAQFLAPAGKWAEAAQAYSAAIARSSKHTPSLYYGLGQALTFTGRHAEACDAFRSFRVLQRPHGLNEATMLTGVGRRRLNSYIEYCDVLPLTPRTILYETFHGASIACSPYAVCLHLLNTPDFAEYTHVWTIGENTRIPDNLRGLDNVVFVKRYSDAYMRALATAEYLLSNVSFPLFFCRREGQKYLNTWHGTPIKYLGQDIKEGMFAHRNVARNFLQATHITSQNTHTNDILLDRYGVARLFDGEARIFGYPRTDLTLNLSTDRQAALRSVLGLTTTDTRKLVLYAPTWRGAHGDPGVDVQQLLSDLAKMREAGHFVVFRAHHMVEKLVTGMVGTDLCIAPSELDTNELLAITDILVTDYSSICFDFFPLQRPVIYYAYDEAKYRADRGLYLELTDLPGAVCHTPTELAEILANPGRLAAACPSAADIEHFLPADDGQSAARVANWFFQGIQPTDLPPPVELSKRPKALLFSGPLLANGIGTSFVNLVREIDPDLYEISLLLPDRAAKDAHPAILERLPDTLQHVSIGNDRMQTLEEAWINDKFRSWGMLPSDEMRQILQNQTDRDFVTYLGRAEIDLALNFEAYDGRFSALLAKSPACRIRRNGIILHNTMEEEVAQRFPYLIRNFQNLNNYDTILSVSKATADQNATFLKQRFSVSQEKLGYFDNLQDPSTTHAQANEPLPEEMVPLFTGAGPVFLTLGRLSVEKDHAKLIRAFHEILTDTPDAKLVILGEGPLRSNLEQQIRRLGLANNVYLPGHTSNPFPMLKQADCFVLSSNHEGQPMVLFEAMILQKPIVATDITGNRGVLQDRAGLLTPNSVEGLAQGMRAFLKGQLPSSNFDADAYQTQALADFYKKVCGLEKTATG
ncbi:CDP-glycerol glycerophosphotransferase family protein [Phaeobacter inhibens]|uniref:CDP-glycerol glycerophosphotransferase family protein n=1 Tax=Phaeobacter inhibens TaxID=221822 RepID=UPI000CA2498A|nr:CDP-glycerol glycerophosphotransferase family protein [Phaeobacter inhibens]AUQ68767.1 putative glycosyl transferase [Phaeobacter inhibens]